MHPPVPSAEHRRLLDALAGDWTSEETQFPGPWHPDTRHGRGRTRNRPGIGGLFLINDYAQDDGAGTVTFQGHGVYGWDPARRRYTMQWFDSMACTGGQVVLGTWEGDTLRFESPAHEGRPGSRYEYEVLGADRYVFRILLAQGDGWIPLMEGRFQRVPASAATDLRGEGR